MRDEWLQQRIAMTKKFGLAALTGFALSVIPFSLKQTDYKVSLVVVGVLMTIPFFIRETVFVIWHWKRRYRGQHRDLWGALLVIETSGWFKILYWFRPILPDWRGTGRYSDQPHEENSAAHSF
jgi:cyanate permease